MTEDASTAVDLTRVAEVLVAHQKVTDGRYACLCGATAPSAIFNGHDTTAMTPFWAWLAAHQAQMLADAGLVAPWRAVGGANVGEPAPGDHFVDEVKVPEHSPRPVDTEG